MREISRKAPVRARGSALTQLNEALALVNDVRGVGGRLRRSLDANRGVVVDARVCTCAGVVIAKRELAESHFFGRHRENTTSTARGQLFARVSFSCVERPRAQA